jgi:hypothetical protein
MDAATLPDLDQLDSKAPGARDMPPAPRTGTFSHLRMTRRPLHKISPKSEVTFHLIPILDGDHN